VFQSNNDIFSKEVRKTVVSFINGIKVKAGRKMQTFGKKSSWKKRKNEK
jgi:hypothetical protein